MQSLKTYDASDSPVLSEYIADFDHNFIGIRGPLGSGKSVASVIKILIAAQNMPQGRDGIRRSKWLIVRNSYRELEDTTLRTWLQWVPEAEFGIYKRQAHIHEVRFNDIELDVIFRSLDTDDDIRKVLSMELTGIWFNEAREISWTIIKNARARLNRYPIRESIPYQRWPVKPTKKDAKGRAVDGVAYWSGVICDTNSPDTRHWWYQFAETPEEACKDRYGNVKQEELDDFNRLFKFYAQPSGLSENAENIRNLSPTYYKDMVLGSDPDWINVYVHNNYGFLIEGKPVFPEYRDDVHCPGGRDLRKDIQAVPGLMIVRAWDFGLTPACTFHQFTAKGQWLILDELGSQDMAIDRFSDLVFTKCSIEYPAFRFIDVGDPAGRQRAQTDEKTCFEIINAKLEKMYGPHFTPIEAGRQEKKLRFESVKKALNTMIDGYPGLIISPKADKTRRGFMGGYQFRKMRTSDERYAQDPDKNEYSHYLDSVQYAGTIFLGNSLVDAQFVYNLEEEEQIEEAFSGRGRNKWTGY